jgi:GAF domain-containing protein/sugar diacid utilization regulator
VVAPLAHALGELVALTEVRGALVAVLQPQRSLDLRHTSALPPPEEATLRRHIEQLLNGASDLHLSGVGTCAGIALAVGDGSIVCAIVRQPNPDQHACLLERGPVVLQSLAREILLQRVRSRKDELLRLNATARRVAASLELDEVLEEIIRDATELLGADMGDIVLLDSETNRLRIVAASRQQESLGIEWSAHKGLSARTMAARRTMVVRDYQRYRDRVEELAAYEVHAVLCAPLITGDAAIGTITVHTRDPAYKFNAHHAQLLGAFASHAAVAIDHARRYQAEVRLARQLREANEQLALSLTLQRRLVEQVVRGQGVAGLARELATLLRRPVVLHDDMLRALAGASPSGSDEWQTLALPGDGLENTELVAFLRELAATGAPSERAAPLADGVPRLVAPVVRSAGEVSGFLVLPWPGQLQALDRALIDVAITGVALELATLRARVDLEHELRGEVVLDLLNGSFSSPDTIRARVRQLGFDLADPRYVAVLSLSDGAPDGRAGDSDQLLARRRFRDIVASRLASVSPASMVATDGDLLVVLAATDGDDTGPALELVEDLTRHVRAALPGTVVSAAVGDRCVTTADYAPAYRLARGALDAGFRLGGPGQIIDARSLGVARLIILSANRDELLEFARARLGSLLEQGGFDRLLLATLRAYVEAGFNQREAARQAFLHPNTVAYRLRKVEERLGLDFEDTKVRLELSLALQIALVAGLLASTCGVNPTNTAVGCVIAPLP